MDKLAVNKRWSEQVDLQEEILFDANDQSLATPLWENYEESKGKKIIPKKSSIKLAYEEARTIQKVNSSF